MNEHLYRSRDDRMLAGVAGGLAEIWDVDPSVVRVVWALLVVLTGGIALLLYIVMAIVVPEEYVGPPIPGDPRTAAAPAASPYIPGWVPPGPTPAAPGPAPSTPGPAAAAPDPAFAAPGATAWVPPMDRRAARRAERAARRAARGDRGSSSAGIVIGLLLVIVGGAFFARELIPAFDFDLFWPLVLIGLGVVLLVAGFTREAGAGPGRSS
jgi:phage shock protein C